MDDFKCSLAFSHVFSEVLYNYYDSELLLLFWLQGLNLRPPPPRKRISPFILNLIEQMDAVSVATHSRIYCNNNALSFQSLVEPKHKRRIHPKILEVVKKLENRV